MEVVVEVIVGTKVRKLVGVMDGIGVGAVEVER